MKIVVTGKTKLFDINKQFRSYYPMLKLAFFTSTHESMHPSSSNALIKDQTLTLEELSKANFSDYMYINVDGTLTITNFEQLFQQQFGFGVQVFHLSIATWLATTNSDWNTLSSLNDKVKAEKEYYSQLESTPYEGLTQEMM